MHEPVLLLQLIDNRETNFDKILRVHRKLRAKKGAERLRGENLLGMCE
jgi:hypothetical protein